MTEVEARRRRKHLTCSTLLIWSLWANNLGVHQIQSETNEFQTRTEIHRVIHDLRGGVNSTGCLVVDNNLDATTAKCGLSAGKTTSTTPTSGVIWRYFKFTTEQLFFEV